MSEGPDPQLLADCVHCGFCLPSCPTYVLWGEEMDSPRGRIHLMLGLHEGDVLTPAAVGHFDACLGCMGCLTSCPSGVQYDLLIESTRALIEVSAPRRRSERLLRASIFALFPYPRRLWWAARGLRVAQALGVDRRLRRSRTLARLLPGVAAMVRLAPPRRSPSALVPDSPPGANAVAGHRDPVVPEVTLLTGCVQSVMFPEVNAATERVLTADGCRVSVPGGQGCCGALSLHAGRKPEALGFARALIGQIDALGGDGAIVTNAAGCGSTLKQYGLLFADDPQWGEPAARFSARVRDVTELLAERGPRAERHPVTAEVAYHDACHLAHAQKVRSQPRSVLGQIPGLSIREIGDGDLCCGSAGIYNIVNPGPAAELGERKADAVLATDADLVVAGNPGCLMQIRSALDQRGTRLPSAHTVELLDLSIRGGRLEDLGPPRSAQGCQTRPHEQ